MTETESRYWLTKPEHEIRSEMDRRFRDYFLRKLLYRVTYCPVCTTWVPLIHGKCGAHNQIRLPPFTHLTKILK